MRSQARKTVAHTLSDITLPAQFSDSEWLRRLLALEKKRRKLTKSSLVFIGIHNISQYWWCGMYSIIKSRHKELELFRAYLEDRITYSLRTGRISSMPTKQEDFLEIGDDLSLKEIEKLYRTPTRSLVVNKQKIQRRSGKAFKLKVDDNFERGMADEYTFAESYPRFRWNFPYSQYVIIGEPDGLTTSFVYEFKSTSQRFLPYTKPVAFTQADFYGYFFKRKSKRIQFRINEDNTVKTFQESVDVNRVKETMSKFMNVDKGKLPVPPIEWKYKSCEYKRECSICQI